MNGNVTRQFTLKLAAVVVAILVLGAGFLFGAALYTGATTVPPETVTQIWLGVGTVFTTAVIAAVGWLQARTVRLSNEAADRRAARTREDAARQVEEIRLESVAEAERIRAHSDQNALQTQTRVEKLIVDINDGLVTKINEGTATLVRDDNTKIAEALVVTNAAVAAEAAAQRLVAQVATNSQAIQTMLAILTAQQVVPVALPDVATGTLAAKIDTLIAGQADTVAQVAALQDDTVLKNSVAVEANTAATIADTARRDEPSGSAV